VLLLLGTGTAGAQRQFSCCLVQGMLERRDCALLVCARYCRCAETKPLLFALRARDCWSAEAVSLLYAPETSDASRLFF
jgi:hypothetical protein